jgi:hypothetical protein
MKSDPVLAKPTGPSGARGLRAGPAGIAIIALLCVGTCTGSAREPDEPKPEGPTEPSEARAETPEDRLYKAQLSACAAVCERLTDCAVAGARENMSAEELADLELEQTSPEHTRRCDESCAGKTLSPRQITVMRECVNGPDECPAYLDCLDRVKPGA